MAGEVGDGMSDDLMDTTEEHKNVPKEKDKEVFSLESILYSACL